MNIIGKKIRKIRELHGLTQEYVAHVLNITQTAYCKIEKGETRITIERLVQISMIFGMRENDILNFDEKFVIHNTVNKQSGTSENMTINYSLVEKEVKMYEERIKWLEEEIIFLRKQMESKGF